MSRKKDFKKIDKRVNWIVKTMNRQVEKDFNGRYNFHQVAKTRDKVLNHLRYFDFELQDKKYPERNEQVRFSAVPHLGHNPLLIELLFRAYNNFVCDGECYAPAD